MSWDQSSASAKGKRLDRFLVSGWYGHGNLGDDLMMCVVESLIRSAGARTSVLLSGSTGTGDLIDAEKVRSRDALCGTAPLGEVIGGGTHFFDLGRPRHWYGSRLARRRVRKWRRERLREQCAITPTAAVGIGIGPFAPASERAAAAKSTLQQFPLVDVRDDQSLAVASRLGLTAYRGGDLAFLSEYWPVPAPPPSRDRGLAVIIPRMWKFGPVGALSREALNGTMRALSRHGLTPVVVLFDSCADEELLRVADVVYRPNRTALRQVLEVLSSAAVVISARAHGAVLGGMAGATVISQALEPKLVEVARNIGAAKWEPPFAVDDLLRLAEARLDSWPVAPGGAIDVEARRAQDTADRLRSIVLASTGST